jgi:hypothetical protein
VTSPGQLPPEQARGQYEPETEGVQVESMHKGARITGLITFIAGMVLLAVAFSAAYGLLKHSRLAPPPTDYRQLPSSLLGILAQGIFLFVMGYIGSLVAARGIQLFGAGADPGNKSSTSEKE